MLLADEQLVAFAATTDGARSIAFYTKVLGLTLRYEDDFAVSLEANGIELRLQKLTEFTPHPFTALGWQVGDIKTIVRKLVRRGVPLEMYPWMEQDEAGLWRAPGGALVAWFKDPDGNLLSVAQYPAD